MSVVKASDVKGATASDVDAPIGTPTEASTEDPSTPTRTRPERTSSCTPPSLSRAPANTSPIVEKAGGLEREPFLLEAEGSLSPKQPSQQFFRTVLPQRIASDPQLATVSVKADLVLAETPPGFVEEKFCCHAWCVYLVLVSIIVMFFGQSIMEICLTLNSPPVLRSSVHQAEIQWPDIWLCVWETNTHPVFAAINLDGRFENIIEVPKNGPKGTKKCLKYELHDLYAKFDGMPRSYSKGEIPGYNDDIKDIYIKFAFNSPGQIPPNVWELFLALPGHTPQGNTGLESYPCKDKIGPMFNVHLQQTRYEDRDWWWKGWWGHTWAEYWALSQKGFATTSINYYEKKKDELHDPTDNNGLGLPTAGENDFAEECAGLVPYSGNNPDCYGVAPWNKWFPPYSGLTQKIFHGGPGGDYPNSSTYRCGRLRFYLASPMATVDTPESLLYRVGVAFSQAGGLFTLVSLIYTFLFIKKFPRTDQERKQHTRTPRCPMSRFANVETSEAASGGYETVSGESEPTINEGESEHHISIAA